MGASVLHLVHEFAPANKRVKPAAASSCGRIPASGRRGTHAVVRRLCVGIHSLQLSSMTRGHWCSLASLVLCAISAGCGSERASVGRVALRPCQLPGIVEPLRCAEVPVPEVRGGGATRTLRLRVVIVPALNPSAANEPWVEVVGGPGNAATDFARQFVEDLGYIRQTHDVLLVDQRGTGGSNPLY